MPTPGPGTTVAQARRLLADRFREAGLDSPELDARLLVGYALGFDHTRLSTEANQPIGETASSTIEALASRRLANEPVARILGIKEFWGLTLHLNDATLVPRPETETVVEAALVIMDKQGARDRPLRIADLGTGSGAILLALLHELPNAAGFGTDISEEALAAARSNAERFGLAPRTTFASGDFGSSLTGRFDLIVSNPPYIPSADIAGLAAEVQRDPRRALDGGADGLDAYRIISKQAAGLLSPRGVLVVEIGIGQESAVAALFHDAGLAPAKAVSDLGGVPRALPACVATMTP